MSKSSSTRIGRVVLYCRGSVWYLRYHESGRRRQVRGSANKAEAKRLAAEINAQLETGAPTILGYEAIEAKELRQVWLDHHEMVLRSSPATVARYRTATDHLLRYFQHQPIKHLSAFKLSHAEHFIRHLRQLQVAPNGHRNTKKRTLRDKGVKFILECCRAMFNFAMKRRHLPPYSENPFSTLEVQRIPLEDAKPIVLLTRDQEEQFFQLCDQWQFSIFCTLALTGLRVGELTHLQVEDVATEDGWLEVRNKPQLGWKIKTRTERRVPLLPELVKLLRLHIGERTTGPLFYRRRFTLHPMPRLACLTTETLAGELQQRQAMLTEQTNLRSQQARLARLFWLETGALKPEQLRLEFIAVASTIGRPDATAPKLFRHAFATALQDGRVDVLIRNQVMGHAPVDGAGRLGGGLGMTGWYTHTRTVTLQEQVFEALRATAAYRVLLQRLEVCRQRSKPVGDQLAAIAAVR